MSDFDWQTTASLATVAVAVIFLARRIYGIIRGSSSASCGTGGCGSCEAADTSNQAGQELPLVTLDATTSNDSNPAAGNP